MEERFGMFTDNLIADLKIRIFCANHVFANPPNDREEGADTSPTTFYRVINVDLPIDLLCRFYSLAYFCADKRL